MGLPQMINKLSSCSYPVTLLYKPLLQFHTDLRDTFTCPLYDWNFVQREEVVSLSTREVTVRHFSPSIHNEHLSCKMDCQHPFLFPSTLSWKEDFKSSSFTTTQILTS